MWFTFLSRALGTSNEGALGVNVINFFLFVALIAAWEYNGLELRSLEEKRYKFANETGAKP